MELTRDIKITRYDNGIISDADEIIVREYALTVFLDGEEFITLLCTPSGLDCLIVGFLLSEGIIKSKDDIKSVRLDEEKGIAEVAAYESSIIAKRLHGKRTVTTGCGRGSSFYNAVDAIGCRKVSGDKTADAKAIIELIREFNKRSELFLSTGGAHSVALAGDSGILLFQEDIGRHNAVDKVIGEAALKGIDLSDKVMLTSGRISSEMLIKSAKGQIPIIVSRSAPTDLAVELAERLGISVVGFARGQRMNVYSSPMRIKL